jgi:hypothetical protein
VRVTMLCRNGPVPDHPDRLTHITNNANPQALNALRQGGPSV